MISSVSSERSVAEIFVDTPTRERVRASFDPAYIIFAFTFAVSGALINSSQRRRKLAVFETDHCAIDLNDDPSGQETFILLF